MFLQQRVDAFERAFAQWPASWPRLVREQGRQVLYATWVLGNNYRNNAAYYGAYPPGFLKRVMALFPEADGNVLHAFSGSLPTGPYVRLDVNPAVDPDVVGSVYDAAALFQPPGWYPFTLVLADPPYSAADAAHYETAGVDRRRALAALAAVTRVGGHCCWLDTCWPMHRKAQWTTVGRIAVIRSTNHRVRLLSLFERTAECI